jgi:PilZ domain
MDRCTPSPSTYVGPERRAHPRIPAAAVPHLTARVAGGPPARLIDLSKRGVQIETTMYMCPGSTVAMRFLSGDASVTLTGAVVRSTVALLESRGEVTYHSALAFTDELILGGEDLEAAAAAALAPPAHTGQADSGDYTMIVMDGRMGTHDRAEATPAC